VTSEPDPVVAVVGGDSGAGAELAAALTALGVSVGSLGVEHLLGSDALRRALDAQAQRLGPLDGVVIASVGPAPSRRGALADLDAASWRDRVEVPLHRTLVCFRGAFDSLRQRGGSMVVLVPTSALVGASGFVPWGAVTEGQRSLAKAAARAWGRHGITVNCVAVPAALLVAGPADRAGGNDGSGGVETSLDRPGQPTPALGHPDMGADVAPVVRALLSPAWRSVTGATLAVDGGVWMTP
jgi:NAD(P)-dependent dehydrogenase (short-subunit alcohol dehydrogenase family)